MGQESFVFYRSFYKAIRKLDNDTLADVVRAMCAYALDGEESELDGVAEIIFDMAKPQIDANHKRRVDGAKGGRPKKEKPVVSENENHRLSEEKPNVNVNVNENVNEDINVSNTNVLDCPTKPDEEPVKYVHKTITDKWNELEKYGITPIRGIATNSARHKYVNARLKQYGYDAFNEIVERIKESDFLQGKHTGKPWQVDFDWVIKPNNFPKVLEGNYKNKSPSGKIEIDSNFRKAMRESEVVDFGI